MKLRHVVLFGFGKAQSPAATAEIIRRFAELKALVPDDPLPENWTVQS